MESERKGHKRKLAETLLESSSSSSSSSQQQQRQQSVGVACTSSSSTALLPQEVELQVSKLNSSFSWREADRLVARRAAHALAEFAKHEEHVDTVVNAGAIPALVQHLEAPPLGDEEGPIALEHEVEKEAALAIGLFAVKPEHQSVIADAGALTCLVSLLKRRGNGYNDRVVNSVLRRAADAITNLAHENCTIKSSIRTEGGILPLVDLLESSDVKVQRAAAAALRTLAFKNEANKHQIVECGALPILIFMLRSEDVGIHYEAVGVIGNLVHSSTNIKKEVLAAGALQPVIGLLSSRCQESQREAALLLGQFATAEPECKAHIVQRGAVRPLSKMLQSSDPQLKEMAAFALGRLAQDSHNQAGIVHDGGLVPLLELLSSKNGSLQHNAAFALYGLADNEDNISDIIKEGGVQKLQEVELIVQPSKDCVAKTLKRLEEKMKGRVLKHLVYLMRVSDKSVQRYVALSLAHLCSVSHQRMIFIENNGLEILLGLLDPSSSLKHQRYGAVALLTLAKRATTDTPVDAALPPPTPQVYLGEKYVNSTVLSDVTFLVEGRRFHAHRIALLASSDAFRAMFDGGYRERDASDIEIPNISWDVFELMMRFIYTGTVEVTLMLAQNLMRAADQYLLEGLKRLCETCIGKNLTIENLANVFDLVESYHANTLGNMCALYFLEHHDQISNMPGYTTLVQRILPEIRDYLTRVLRP